MPPYEWETYFVGECYFAASDTYMDTCKMRMLFFCWNNIELWVVIQHNYFFWHFQFDWIYLRRSIQRQSLTVVPWKNRVICLLAYDLRLQAAAYTLNFFHSDLCEIEHHRESDIPSSSFSRHILRAQCNAQICANKPTTYVLLFGRKSKSKYLFN